jgi:hypothetical protein
MFPVEKNGVVKGFLLGEGFKSFSIHRKLLEKSNFSSIVASFCPKKGIENNDKVLVSREFSQFLEAKGLGRFYDSGC